MITNTLNFTLLYFNLFFLNDSLITASGGVKLSVENTPQKYSLSCEAAALKSALSFYDISVTEDQIIQKIPFDKTPKSQGIWGDPNVGFVGAIDGIGMETGYGIHWKPMAKVARNWKPTTIIEYSSLTELAFSILNNRPVILWVYNGEAPQTTWSTPAGKKIYAVESQHAVVVHGFEGSPDNPLGFYVMDPAAGLKYWDIPQITNRWKIFNNSGLILQE